MTRTPDEPGDDRIDRSDDVDRSTEEDEGASRRPGSGAAEWFSSIRRALEALGDRDERRRDGRRSGIDLHVSIGSALDPTDRSRPVRGLGRTPDRRRTRWSPVDRSRRADDARGRRTGAVDSDAFRDREAGAAADRADGTSAGGYNVTTRRRDDELLVAADVSGTDEDELTAGFRGAELVVRASGRDLARVEVPWPDRTAAARVRNGILTIRIGHDTND